MEVLIAFELLGQVVLVLVAEVLVDKLKDVNGVARNYAEQKKAPEQEPKHCTRSLICLSNELYDVLVSQ